MTDSKITMNLRGFPPWCVAQSTNIKELKSCRLKISAGGATQVPSSSTLPGARSMSAGVR
jgi:hypothetical protein